MRDSFPGSETEMKNLAGRIALLALIGALAPSALALPPVDPAQTRPRGYSIPTIDLAGDKDRQIVVDREAGQYLGHPTTVLLEDGKTILCVYPRGHGRGRIVLKRSTDGGRTWSGRLKVPDNWSTSLETPTIHRVIDSTGKKRLILFSGLYPIRMSVSEDDGETWSPLAKIGDFGGIVAMADVVRLMKNHKSADCGWTVKMGNRSRKQFRGC